MRELQTLGGRGALGALLLVALASCALWAAAGAAAQSGRRRTPQQQPTAQPSPDASPQGESESESRPRPAGAKDSTALASFIVMELDELTFGADYGMRADVVESFAARLRRTPSVSVSGGGRGSRGDARQRAKGETTAFVVLVALEDEYGGGGPNPGPRGSQQERNRALAVRTSVFEPKTGALKYTDTIHQRPVRSTVGVGGIGLPIPTRTIGRYPAQLELRQAAHDAADRLLSRFSIIAPPGQP
jgi:hypothetical protein